MDKLIVLTKELEDKFRELWYNRNFETPTDVLDWMKKHCGIDMPTDKEIEQGFDLDRNSDLNYVAGKKSMRDYIFKKI